MTLEECKLLRLQGQHLLAPVDTQIAVRDLCGIQAQYLSHAIHGLSLRCGAPDISGLVKTWTLRGTMHLISENDLPLFLHQGRKPFLRSVDTLESDTYIGKERKAYFASLILDTIAEGTDTREGLKDRCRAAGMSEAEERSLFDPWGGIIRALCEEGRICHRPTQEKAYRLCPDFSPMDLTSARRELLRRYFTHFGPATIKDASYFFGIPQREIKSLIPQISVVSTEIDGKAYFYIPDQELRSQLPRCIFLAGFDQLMLGYEKTENLFLPREHVQDIFTLSGIVRPTLLVDGTVAGYWNLKNRKLTVRLFFAVDQSSIQAAAENLWSDLKKIEFL